MPPSNITILHFAAPPTIGGVESTIADHARLFANHGYNCQVIAGTGEVFDPRIPVRILSDLGSKSPLILEINSELAVGTVSDRFRLAVDETSRILAQQVRLDSRSVLIAHNALSLHKNLVMTSALDRLHQQHAFRLIAWCHDFAWTDPQYAGEMHSGYPWDLLRVPWPNVDYVVVSEGRRRELVALWEQLGKKGPQVRVIPPGIDPCEFLGIGGRSMEWINRFELLNGAPLLLLPARLTRRKRIEYAIEVVRELVDLGHHAKLVITGPPGPHNPKNATYLEQLEEQIKSLPPNTVILGHKYGPVTREVMRDLYLLSDALVFPSEREGFGIPLLEAGLARLPIFCSDIQPFREIASEKAHYIDPGGPARQAAELIAGTLEYDTAYSLKHRVLDEFSWERIFTERIEPLVR